MKNDTQKSLVNEFRYSFFLRIHKFTMCFGEVDDEFVCPKEYEKSIQKLVSKRVSIIFLEYPHMPSEFMLSRLTRYLLEDLSPKLLLKMTKFATKKWDKLTGNDSCRKTNFIERCGCSLTILVFYFVNKSSQSGDPSVF